MSKLNHMEHANRTREPQNAHVRIDPYKADRLAGVTHAGTLSYGKI
jgi:hypothetical protein